MSKQNRNSKKDFKRKILGLLVISLPHTVESMEQDTGQLDAEKVEIKQSIIETEKLEAMITQLIVEITLRIKEQVENYDCLMSLKKDLNSSIQTEETHILSSASLITYSQENKTKLAALVAKIRETIDKAKNNSILVRTAEHLKLILLYINSQELPSAKVIGECSEMVKKVRESYESDTGIHLKATTLPVMNIKKALTEVSGLCKVAAGITKLFVMDAEQLPGNILWQLDELINLIINHTISNGIEAIQSEEEQEVLATIIEELFKLREDLLQFVKDTAAYSLQVREDLLQLVKRTAPKTTKKKLEEKLAKNETISTTEEKLQTNETISTTEEVELEKNETTTMSPQTTEYQCFRKK